MVAECFAQVKLTPHGKNGNVFIFIYIYGTNIFYADMFYGTDICLKIYMYTCIFTILTLGPTRKHP